MPRVSAAGELQMATRGWTPSMTEATPSRLVDIPLEVCVVLIDVDHEEAELYRCAEAIFADQRIAAPATRTMCAHDAAHGHGDRGRRWHNPGDIWTRNHAIHELGRGVLCVYLGARMVCGMQLTGRETCRRSHAAERARMHDIIVQHEKRLESRSDHVQTSEPGMSRLHS